MLQIPNKKKKVISCCVQSNLIVLDILLLITGPYILKEIYFPCLTSLQESIEIQSNLNLFPKIYAVCVCVL